MKFLFIVPIVSVATFLFASLIGQEPYSSSDSRLTNLEYQHKYMMNEQKLMEGQLKDLNSLSRQVYQDAGDLHNVIERVRIHEASQLNDPAVIATLQTKMSWCLAILSILFTGSFSWMITQLKANQKLATDLRLYHNVVKNRHDQLDNILGVTTTEAPTLESEE
jgi:hypothetical protein